MANPVRHSLPRGWNSKASSLDKKGTAYKEVQHGHTKCVLEPVNSLLGRFFCILQGGLPVGEVLLIPLSEAAGY